METREPGPPDLNPGSQAAPNRAGRKGLLGLSTSQQELLRVWPDVGRILKVGRSTAYELVKSGQIPSVKISESIVRVRAEDLERYIESRVGQRDGRA
jgi:excisionase family DNA binding protein